jgi:transposase
MWTDESRPKYERRGLRYPSDLTDEEWALIEPLLPLGRKPPPHKPPVDRRRVLNALLYVLTTGCQWRQLPKDFPPKSTVHDYFVDWRGLVLARVHNALYAEARRLAERQAEPTLAIVDSQSVKSAEKGGLASMRPVTTGQRKSKARSVISPSIRRAC